MIIADFRNSSRYQRLHPDFEEIFQYLNNTNWQEVDFGKIQLEDKTWFVIYSNPQCVPQQEQVLEYHKKYLDIHLLFEGEETIGWKSLNDCTQHKKEYDPTDDYGLFGDTPTTFVKIVPNQFVIVYPEDAHAPIIGQGKIRKIVVKVEV